LKTYALSHCLIAGGGIMSKEAIFTMKLEAELHSRFVDEAWAANRPALQVVR